MKKLSLIICIFVILLFVIVLSKLIADSVEDVNVEMFTHSSLNHFIHDYYKKYKTLPSSLDQFELIYEERRKREGFSENTDSLMFRSLKPKLLSIIWKGDDAVGTIQYHDRKQSILSFHISDIKSDSKLK